MRDADKTKKQLIAELVELRRRNAELQAEQIRVREVLEYEQNLINSSLDMIISVDRDRRIIEFNKAAQEAFGYTREEILGKHVDVLYSDPRRGLEIHRTVRKEGRYTGEVVNKRRDGSTFTSFLSASSLSDAEGKFMGVMGISRDITHRKQMEEALRDSEKKLRETMFEKRVIRLEKLASIGRLCVNLAHELGNPLNGIHRYVRLLLDQMSQDDPTRVYAERARDGLVRVENKIIGGLSDLAQRSTPIFRSTDIAQSIRRILASFRYEISTQNIEVETQFGENIPAIFNADVPYIFENIIKNSIQAMRDGGTLCITAAMVSPQLLEVMFSDTGPGIADDMREKIFEPFYTTRDVGEGVGLGLAISQGLAESYNGTIGIESELGKGTTFIVRLPIGEDGLTVSDTDA